MCENRADPSQDFESVLGHGVRFRLGSMDVVTRLWTSGSGFGQRSWQPTPVHMGALGFGVARFEGFEQLAAARPYKHTDLGF